MQNELMRRLFSRVAVGLGGLALTGDERRLLHALRPAGIVLFARNVADGPGVRRLVEETRETVVGAGGDAPLVLADQEGGRISVLAAAAGAPPTQSALACCSSPVRLAVYRSSAARMRALGVDFLLGPLADTGEERLNPVIGVRSFGAGEAETADLVREAVGIYRRDVLSCIKHFPGHGSASRDSHLTLPVLSRTLAELRERDILPFAAGIAAGADAVMTAHVAPRGRTRPASLDPEIVDGLLRRDMGFGGAIVTDALEMAGAGGDAAAAAGAAIEAGSDLLLFSAPIGQAAAALESALKSGTLDPALLAGPRHEDALGRLHALRRRAEGLPPAVETGDAAAIPAADDEAAAEAIEVRGPLPTVSSFRFAGEEEDLRGPVVSRFARLLLGAANSAGALPAGSKPPGTVGPVFRAPETGETRRLRIVDLPGGASPDACVLFCRRPVTPAAVEEACGYARVLVVAGWPWAEGERRRTVVVTRGTWDAAAAAVGRLLGKEKSD
ncbi:MAG: glycoside hydrolase family 3 protein [Candidatus Krumholzibacteriota bacterium]|nr:glycoside hydrolase family 3 protein [Candidatus Krumholzibacteriota bacterium]